MSVPIEKSKAPKEKAVSGSAGRQPAPRYLEHPFFTLRDRIDQLFDDVFSDLPTMSPRSWDFEWPSLPRLSAAMCELAPVPRTDISETDKDYVIRAELPSMSEKDIEVTVSDNTLTIKGEKRTERKEKDADYHVRECSYGAVRRSFRLPDSVNQDKAKAEFDSGVLTLTLPKVKKAAPKKIAVNLKTK